MLREIRQDPPGTRLRAQEAASALLGAAWAERSMGQRDAEEELVRRLVREAASHQKPTASLALHCLATMPDTWGPLVAEALAGDAGRTAPPWSDGTLAVAPEEPARVEEWSDPWGSSRVFVLHYVEPEPHLLAVAITTPGGVLVETIALAGPGADPSEGFDVGDLVGDVDPSAALATIADALWQTDMYWPPSDDPGYVTGRALLHWRTSRHRAEHDWQPVPDAERRALLDDFAREHGAELGLDASIVEVLTDTFVDFGDGYIAGGVLAWSPGHVEVFMLEWVHRKVVMDDEAMEALPTVLKAWVRFALGRRGLVDEDIEPVVDAVEQLRDDYTEARSDAGGPAAQLMSRLMAAGVDLHDSDAVAQAVSSYNAEQIARRALEER